jgi:hypothetical protein
LKSEIIVTFLNAGLVVLNGFQKKSQKIPRNEIELDEKQKKNNLTSFTDHLDVQYGKKRTPEREEFEVGFESFRIGVMLQELRKEQGITQEQLAARCSTA